jgi:hypothetical protein
MAASSSAWLDAWLALYRLLCEESWPNVTVPADRFVLACVYPKTGPPMESVLLVTDSQDTLDQDWAASSIGGRQRDESFTIQLIVSTFDSHQTWQAAGARLKQLAQVVEQVLHRTSRVQDRNTLVPELATVLKGWQISSIIPEIGLMDNGTFGGIADVRILVESRIQPTTPT